MIKGILAALLAALIVAGVIIGIIYLFFSGILLWLGGIFVVGIIVGAVILVVFPELLRFLGMPSSIAAPMRQMIYGLLLVILMIRRPQGVLGVYRFR